MLQAVTDVDRLIAPIVVQRVKGQLLFQNPLHEAIALHPHKPEIAGSTATIAVVLAIPISLVRHVLIPAWINSPILDSRLRVFLTQEPLQIL